MIVWGGEPVGAGGESTNTGGVYNPVTDSWTTTSLVNAPSARASNTPRSGRSDTIRVGWMSDSLLY